MKPEDKCVSVDTEFNNLKQPFIGTTCDWRLKTTYHNLHEEKDIASLKRMCEDRALTKVMFPYTVDAHVLKNVGIRCKGPWEDPLIAGTLLDENFANRKGLKAMAQRYLKADILPAKKLSQYKKKYKKIAKQKGIEFDYSQIPTFVMKPYATEDPIFAQKLWFVFREPIKQFQAIYDFEKKVAPIILKMQERGMMVDRKFVKKQSDIYAQEIENVQGRIRALLKKSRISMKQFKSYPIVKSNSYQQVGYVLEQIGIELPRNERGNPITDSKVLATLDSHKIVSEFLLDRFFRKQKSVYFDPLFKRHTTAEDPYAHFFLFQSGARTGRTSAELIQTIPRPEESRTAHAPKIARQAFVPRPGYVFLAVDYKALQMMIFFHFAKAKALIKKVWDGWDPHDAACKMLFGKVEKERRKITKNIQFGLVFGMGMRKLLRVLSQNTFDGKTVSALQADQILKTYYDRVPVKAFTAKCVSELYSTGVLKLEFESELMNFHREYRVPQELAYKGPNVKIQGTEAYVVKSAMVRCDELIEKKGMDVHMLMCVHDELLFEVSEKEPIPLIIEEITKAMEDYVTFDVPLRVEAKISDKSWGETKDWKEVSHLYQRRKAHGYVTRRA